MTNRGWLPSEIAELQARWARDEDAATIGAALDRTAVSVIHMARRMDLSRRRASYYDTSIQVGRPWTQDDVTQVRKMRRAGQSWLAIGRAVGRSDEAARRHLLFVLGEADPFVPVKPVAPTPTTPARTGIEPLPAYHPTTWQPLLDLTPCLRLQVPT